MNRSTENAHPLALVGQIVAWTVFLPFLVVVWGIPLQAHGTGALSIAYSFFGLLLFSGLFVVVAVEFFVACFRTESDRLGAQGLFVLFVVMLVPTYYAASAHIAHSELTRGLLILMVWFVLVWLAGCAIRHGLPTAGETWPAAALLISGSIVLVVSNAGWSVFYGKVLRPEYLSSTPFWSATGAVLLWLILGLSYRSMLRSQKWWRF